MAQSDSVILKASSGSIAAAIGRIPTINRGSTYYFVFSDRVIAVDRVLQIVPIFNQAGNFQNEYIVSTIDFSSVNSLTLTL